MKNYLHRLKQFEVNIRFDRDAFFANANLTDAERRYLEKHIGEVNLCYKVVLQNKQEMFIFLVELSNWDNEYAEVTTAKMFASTLPYNIIVALRNGKAVRFWAFDRRDNIRNLNRSVIDACYYSPTVLLDRKGSIDRNIAQSVSYALLHGKNSSEVVEILKYSFKEEHQQHREEHVQMLINEGRAEVDPYDGGVYILHNEEYGVINEIYGEESDEWTSAAKNTRKDDWKITRAYDRFDEEDY